jgi:hypothetical protein
MVGDHAEEVCGAVGTGEVQDVRACFEAGASDGGFVSFDGNQGAGTSKFLYEGEEF